MNQKSNQNVIFLLSFALFGLTALIFQVVFVKQLVLLFGLTAPAVATVLAVYFSGLALGSIFIGKLVDRFHHMARRIYVFLFLLTGMYGISFPFLFPVLNKVILAINQVYPLNFSGFNFFAFLLAFIFLIFPAILIGGGFPTVNKLFIRREEKLGGGVSLIYFVETFGSVIGALLAGFWLIPAIGNNATIMSAGVLNIILAGFLFAFFRSQNYAEQYAEPRGNISINSRLDQRPSASTTMGNPIFLYVLFITGFLALALEVLYTKTLILFIGSSTYAFSLILITFLLGIALGSWAASLFIDRIQRGYAYFGLFLGLIGFWLFVTSRFFEQIPFWYLDIFKTYESFSFSAILSAQFLLTILVIFPATFLMGIIFPLAIRLSEPAIKKLAAGIGKLYFANTIGGVLGSVATGFVLLPNVGYKWTLILITVSYLFLAGFFILREKKLEPFIKGAFIFFVVFWGGFTLFTPPWSKRILSLGVFPYARFYTNISKDMLLRAAKQDKILFYKEGLSNVAVIQRGGEKFLRINGKTDAGNSLGDLEAEILIGALPMLFSENPKDVLVVGLGSGITLGTITQFTEAQNIDVVEIDPAVVEAADYFKEDNHDALYDPRVKLIVADGRNHLFLTDKKYDVISSEPSNFWVSGNAALFTKEFYELAKSHLKENGVILQWLYAYNLGSDDIKSVIKTFQSVFPQTYLFNSMSGGDLFLVGSLSEKPLLNFSRLEKKFDDSQVKEELGRLFIHNLYQLLMYLVAGNQGLEEYVFPAKVHTDDNSFLEFSAPKTIYKDTLPETLKELFSLSAKQNPADLVVGGENEKLKKYFEFARELISVKIALNEQSLFEVIDAYKEVMESSGLKQPFLEGRILRLCTTFSFLASGQGRKDISEKIGEKCQELVNSIEISNG